ncbi:MAG: hypothetical protein GEU93_08795 [Propionibacteriales bacterium]|nr:hypothetical protein [Propionibacteriales bacterium]
MDLDTVADELYGLPLDEFTKTRNARAKEARAEGDRELAAAIQQLTKPSTSAWLINRLSRELAEELQPLIDLGRDLREATANLSGDELRALTRQRHQVVHALVQQVRRLGAAAGHRVSDDVATAVRQTLEASLADPEVADAVLSGRLTRPAEYAGFGEPTGVAWHPRQRRSAARTPRSAGAGDRGSGAEVADLAARRRETAERKLADAAAALESARSAHETATREREEAAGRLQRAEEEVGRLRAALRAAEEEAGAAQEADRQARRRLDHSGRGVRVAESKHQDAAARLAELDVEPES